MSRNIYIFLVIMMIFALKEHQILSVASCPKRKEFGSAFIGQALVGPVLYSFTSNGEVLCQFNCHANDDCDKYNFNSETNRCEMLDKHYNYAVENKNGWMFKTIKCEGDPCYGSLCYENGGPICVCAFKWMGKYCEVQALGIEDKTIPDLQITASSSYNSGHAPYRGRLNNYPQMPYNVDVDTGSWSAGSNQVGEYLQVDLGRVVYVTMVATQGRPYHYDQWVTKYKINYRDDSDSVLKEYQEGGTIKEFHGNGDKDTVVQNQLAEELRAQIIRFVVLQWNIYISMRVELYGIPI